MRPIPVPHCRDVGGSHSGRGECVGPSRCVGSGTRCVLALKAESRMSALGTPLPIPRLSSRNARVTPFWCGPSKENPHAHSIVAAWSADRRHHSSLPFSRSVGCAVSIVDAESPDTCREAFALLTLVGLGFGSESNLTRIKRRKSISLARGGVSAAHKTSRA